ncbi:MAG: phosphoketolase family protein [Acidimicrobiales bacterium]
MLRRSAPSSAGHPLSAGELAGIDAWWRAANYLAVGQIYLLANPLLREPLTLDHIKPRLLGHWGTTPGLNLLYAHLNRVINQRDLDMIFVAGPGHGGPAVVASTYLEGTYSEIYPEVATDAEGLARLFRQFSFPGGIPSHAAPETPGSIHEGGELGYSLSHAFGAAFDNPDLVVACVIGDGEAETGPLAASWHSNKFLDPVTDGMVLPILHRNGYKIANPTVLDRLGHGELTELLRGYGWEPHEVAGDDPPDVHRQLADALDRICDDIAVIQRRARVGGDRSRPRWPCLVLRTPKGWTGPHTVDGEAVEGTWRAHQLPLSADAQHPEHVAQLEAWMRSYRPEELFDDAGRVVASVTALAPAGDRRMGANPHANGGRLLRPLRLPDFRSYAVAVERPAATVAEATRVMGGFLRDVMAANADQANFRVFGPDETASNRLGDLLDVTGRAWVAPTAPVDDALRLRPDGRVMEILSEHTCQGWLEGYLLTGRHGLFSCYEAFIHIIDSMFNQHAKWLKVSSELEWRPDIASLNYLLTSHVWRQDHNGFSHQDPGFIDHVVNKKAEHVRVYLPPDANTLLSVTDHCLRSRQMVNVIVAGKQPALQYLDMDAAVAHATKGIGIWEWASNDEGSDPDVVMACCGDIPTLETLAAVGILRRHAPHLKVRVVNVVDLMTLQPQHEHPHGLSDQHFDSLFGTDVPVIFNFHGYPWLIHRLTYRRHNHDHIHVRGYKEEGTTTTPFDMCVLNQVDRFHLVQDVIDRVAGFGPGAAYLREHMANELVRHASYIRAVGQDLPEVRGWEWEG